MFEADLNGGDSGSPLLTAVGGELVLLGLGSGSGTVDLGGDGASLERDTSIFSFTGNYAEDITDFIEANTIPEPSSVVLALTACLGLIGRRQR